MRHLQPKQDRTAQAIQAIATSAYRVKTIEFYNDRLHHETPYIEGQRYQHNIQQHPHGSRSAHEVGILLPIQGDVDRGATSRRSVPKRRLDPRIPPQYNRPHALDSSSTI